MRCVSDVPAGGDDGAGGGDDGDPGGEYQAARPGWQQPHAVQQVGDQLGADDPGAARRGQEGREQRVLPGRATVIKGTARLAGPGRVDVDGAGLAR
jgi:hypothetical protein